MNAMLSRRALLASGLMLGGLALLPSGLLAATAATDPETIDLAVSPSRSTKLVRWVPAGAPRGVLLFSHGHGAEPLAYRQLFTALVAQGYAVLAPMHVDSQAYPDRDKFGQQQGFLERLADMRAISALAVKQFAGVPVAAVGHSYGSLIALCLGGALADLMPMRDPTVSAVLTFSSAGKVQGLVKPGSYASLAVPALMITGTEDMVPNFVTDPADHLFPIETSPAKDKYALVFKGTDHFLGSRPDGARFADAIRAATLFLIAYVPPNNAAKADLKKLPIAPGDRFLVRDEL